MRWKKIQSVRIRAKAKKKDPIDEIPTTIDKRERERERNGGGGLKIVWSPFFFHRHP